MWEPVTALNMDQIPPPGPASPPAPPPSLRRFPGLRRFPFPSRSPRRLVLQRPKASVIFQNCPSFVFRLLSWHFYPVSSSASLTWLGSFSPASPGRVELQLGRGMEKSPIPIPYPHPISHIPYPGGVCTRLGQNLLIWEHPDQPLEPLCAAGVGFLRSAGITRGHVKCLRSKFSTAGETASKARPS